MKKLLWAAAATVFISTAAMATVTFDPQSGTGFVGKGDVQTAFGWNNSQIQKNAGGVTFTYNLTAVYDVTCEWQTVTGGPNSRVIIHDVTVPRHINVNDTVSYTARTQNQISGFILNGFGSETDGATIPQVGDSCPNGGDGTIVEVDETSYTAGLFVNYGGNSVQIA
jgi:hypothetical protein